MRNVLYNTGESILEKLCEPLFVTLYIVYSLLSVCLLTSKHINLVSANMLTTYQIKNGYNYVSRYTVESRFLNYKDS